MSIPAGHRAFWLDTSLFLLLLNSVRTLRGLPSFYPTNPEPDSVTSSSQQHHMIPSVTSKACLATFWQLSTAVLGKDQLIKTLKSPCWRVLKTSKHQRIPQSESAWFTQVLFTHCLRCCGHSTRCWRV